VQGPAGGVANNAGRLVLQGGAGRRAGRQGRNSSKYHPKTLLPHMVGHPHLSIINISQRARLQSR
jgi:hypothetical protein